MPRIIREALAQRLLNSPRSAAFLRDFSLATGLPLRFATPLGLEGAVAGTRPEPNLCAWMRSDSRRERLCARTIQEGALGGMAGRSESGCGERCAAGLREAAVPLRFGEEVFGYLLVGQVATQPLDGAALNRWRHALEGLGQRIPLERLQELAGGVERVPQERFAAALRLLEEAAGRLAGHMEEHLAGPAEQLSPSIRKACSFIRTHFEEELPLGRVAAELGLSRGHFCAAFHRGTGLRFVEYLTRVRVERASELLQSTERSVAEIAFGCGFQSLSQFNRSFRRIKGVTPRSLRAKGRR